MGKLELGTNTAGLSVQRWPGFITLQPVELEHAGVNLRTVTTASASTDSQTHAQCCAQHKDTV